MRIPILAALVLLLAAGGVWLLRADESSPASAEPAWEYRADGRYVGPELAPTTRPNLVVLILDTLRADCVHGAPGAQTDMPFVSGLAKRGLACTQVTAPAPSTHPSLTSLLTGLAPEEHRVDHTPYPVMLPPSITTFAEILSRGHGYETAAIMQLEFGAARPDASPLQGMQTIRAGGPLRWARKQVPGWNAQRDKQKPFFLLLHTYEGHDPYGEANHPWPERLPTEAEATRARALYDITDAQFVEHFVLDRGVRVNWLEADPSGTLRRAFEYYGRGFAEAPDRALAARLENAYRKGVRWLDSEVEKTVAMLEAEGLLENTLLVVTSDHGEAFGEHGVLLHGRALHEELVHVPLVAVGPAPFDTGRSVDTSMGLIDVLPTFLELAGLPALADVAGRSMLEPLRTGAPGRAVMSAEELTPFKMGTFANVQIGSARTATESFILTFDLAAGTVIEEFFDRATDPAEEQDLAVNGRLGDLMVSAAMAAAVEQVRDRIWGSVASSKRHAQLGYGAGVATATSVRPASPRVRLP